MCTHVHAHGMNMYISIHMHVRDAHPRTYRATDGEVLSRRAERLLPALRLSVKLSPPRNESPCTRHVRDMREMNGHKCVRPAHHGVNGTRANGDDGLLGAGQQGRSHTAPRLHHARATAGSGADRGGEGGERRDKSRQGALAHWHAHAPAPAALSRTRAVFTCATEHAEAIESTPRGDRGGAGDAGGSSPGAAGDAGGSSGADAFGGFEGAGELG